MYTKGKARIDIDYDFDGEPMIVLPHSCDEWVIGGSEQAQQLIEDLQELIKQFPKT